MTVPRRLKDDAIVEAVGQISFAAPNEVAEVVLGRLSDFQPNDYTSSRLPIADVPAQVRHLDPNLRLQPLLELRHKSRPLVRRIGDFSLSTHCVGVAAYPGWKVFRDDLDLATNQLFNKIPSAQITTCSLRYINAIVFDRHHIQGVKDLALEVHVAGKRFSGPLNLNVREEFAPNFFVTTRIADTGFVEGKLPPGTSAIVDVEVVAAPDFRPALKAEVADWFEQAHTYEKDAFFRLLPASAVQQLIEED